MTYYPMVARGEWLRFGLIRHNTTARNAFTTRGKSTTWRGTATRTSAAMKTGTAKGSTTTARRATTDRERMAGCSELSEDKWLLFDI